MRILNKVEISLVAGGQENEPGTVNEEASEALGCVAINTGGNNGNEVMCQEQGTV